MKKLAELNQPVKIYVGENCFVNSKEIFANKDGLGQFVKKEMKYYLKRNSL